MPFVSKAQARKLFATNPKLARRWAKLTPDISALPEHQSGGYMATQDRPAGKPGSLWIQKMKMKKGALHKQLGTPAGETIPPGKVSSAAKSNNPLLARRARLAITLAKLRGKRKAKGG